MNRYSIHLYFRLLDCIECDPVGTVSADYGHCLCWVSVGEKAAWSVLCTLSVTHCVERVLQLGGH